MGIKGYHRYRLVKFHELQYSLASSSSVKTESISDLYNGIQHLDQTRLVLPDLDCIETDIIRGFVEPSDLFVLDRGLLEIEVPDSSQSWASVFSRRLSS